MLKCVGSFFLTTTNCYRKYSYLKRLLKGTIYLKGEKKFSCFSVNTNQFVPVLKYMKYILLRK